VHRLSYGSLVLNLNRLLLDLTGYDLALRMRWRLASFVRQVAPSRVGWISLNEASWGNSPRLRAGLHALSGPPRYTTGLRSFSRKAPRRGAVGARANANEILGVSAYSDSSSASKPIG
jgi:hypothetical protein